MNKLPVKSTAEMQATHYQR